ncbi:feruloyl esterase [Amycolatopsis mediterranei S699]|uniref:Feruloyl esterase n=2 Tax=Amycolatopsis mediterranei TaxID=33910 RepID=A0A0H3D6T5_AMYMU|nr:tannase/feruloyl esterase family alpha/beta hydrolase [Amycolatopsis mediterranei]ADJ45778.1 feruloyl esterase [Amycolatopsis mediterranei U32]AFO77489.1 feruloyl esterase [Amycolatopsis mediterranei S699]AGT84617.1 feruloyl esterase [Amycolatopsis mediterranei RB]KDO05314.1 feruloyl esterase [Amycolatopsis mediterranei]KDU88108.1 feruloyl esterase [Amycolatopsis mediterranei]
MRKTLRLAVSAALVLAASAPVPAAASPAAPDCAGLAGVRIPASVMSLPTSGGVVTAASVVPGGYCRVDADLHPVDPAAPAIKLRVALPLAWNHKALMFGGGGYNGTIPDVTANVPFGPADRPAPLARGYATFASDSGHQQNPASPPSLDGSFGVNDEALVNFAAGDALKKTRDASLFLIRRAYAATPTEVFFAGGSTGGREALVVAQRWPSAFDGVISAYPAWNNMAEILDLGYLAQVLSRPGAFPDPAKQTLLYNSVIKACDGLDGVTDGIVSNPGRCRFDPRVLRCPGGTDTGPACLSDPQIGAVTAVSAPFRWPYRIAGGETEYPGFPFLSGADMRTPFLGFGTTAPADPMPVTSGYGMQYWDQWVKYFLTRDPGHRALDVDPRRPGKWLARISALSSIEDRNNADLRPFARAGGKLILMHGAADELVSPYSTSDYYERVRSVAGPRVTESFLRYYVVPGANHANFGTPAFAASWDSLTALERWVEGGRAPAGQVVTDLAHPRTRPLCTYPEWPRYRGGDPDSAASFFCAR